MSPIDELPSYLDAALAAETLPALRDAALDTASLFPGTTSWLAVDDPGGGPPGVWTRTLSPERTSLVEALYREHPFTLPDGTAPVDAADIGEVWPAGPIDRLHLALGATHHLVIPVGAPPCAFLVLGRSDRAFDLPERDLASLIGISLAAACRHLDDRERFRTARAVASRELQREARIVVLRVGPGGMVRSDDLEPLDPEVQVQLEALLAGAWAGSGPGASPTGDILLIRRGDATTGALRLRVLPPDEEGLSLVLARLAVDAPYLEDRGLSARQAEVMALVLAGSHPDEIGERLGISTATVRKHTENAYRALGVRSLTEFALQVF